MVYSYRAANDAGKAYSCADRAFAHEEALDRYRRIRNIAISQSGVPVDWQRGEKSCTTVKRSDEEIKACKAEWRAMRTVMEKAGGKAAANAVDALCDERKPMTYVEDYYVIKALDALAEYCKIY